MLYSIEYRTAVLKFIQALPEDEGRRLFAAIEALADNPRPRGHEQINEGNRTWFVAPIRAHSVSYEIHDRRLIIVVVHIENETIS